MSLNTIRAFCDGSMITTGRKSGKGYGGFACIILYPNNRRKAIGGYCPRITTANEMELRAIVAAIDYTADRTESESPGGFAIVDGGPPISIYSDSQWAIKGCNGDFNVKVHRALFNRAIVAKQNRIVTFNWFPRNETPDLFEADKLAKAQAQRAQCILKELS